MRRTLLLCAALAGAALVAGHQRSATPRPVAFDPRIDDFELAPETQRFLWKLEQHAFVLGHEVAPRLEAALRDRDRAAFLAWLGPEFRARVPRGKGRAERHGSVHVRTWDGESRTLDGDGWYEWLVGRSSRYRELERRRFHFEQLEPARRDDVGGRARGTCTLHFVGKTEAGKRGWTTMHWELGFDTLPASADATGYLASAECTNAVHRHVPAALMAETTAHCGIDTSTLVDRWAWTRPEQFKKHASLASYLLDFDRDGRLDLLLCDRRIHLWRGRGDGTFEDATRKAGLPVHSRFDFIGATVADFDNDGDEDVLADVVRDGVASNAAYENRDGVFVPLPPSRFRQLGVSVSNGAIADFDNDGLVDLYLANSGPMPPPDQERHRWIGDQSSRAGVLLRNRGGFRFEDVTARAGAAAGHRDIFAAAWFDLEGDGDPDLFLANHFGENPLLENLGDGTFADRRAAEGFGGFSMGLAMGDLDGDGDSDAYLANMSSWAGGRIFANLRPNDFPPGLYPLVVGFVEGNVALENRGRDFVRASEQGAGWAYGPALCDLDGDGALDVYCPAGFQSVDRRKPDG